MSYIEDDLIVSAIRHAANYATGIVDNVRLWIEYQPKTIHFRMLDSVPENLFGEIRSIIKIEANKASIPVIEHK